MKSQLGWNSDLKTFFTFCRSTTSVTHRSLDATVLFFRWHVRRRDMSSSCHSTTFPPLLTVRYWSELCRYNTWGENHRGEIMIYQTITVQTSCCCFRPSCTTVDMMLCFSNNDRNLANLRKKVFNLRYRKALVTCSHVIVDSTHVGFYHPEAHRGL